jgi:SWIM zinc finger
MAGLDEIIRDGRGYLVPSISEPGTMQAVRLSPASCDCKGFQYRGLCRHVLAVVAMYDARGPMASTQEL